MAEVPYLLLAEGLGADVSGVVSSVDESGINRLECNALANKVISDIDVLGV